MDFFYDASGNAYALKYNGTLYYYITNLQGDVMSIVDETGTPVATYEYDPYGNIVTTTGTLAEVNPLRYRGYYYDSESGFYYLQSRYYDPELGRFINADAMTSTGQGLLGNNMFVYCLNNPVRYADCSGEIAKEATEDENEEEQDGYRIVGAGIQVNIDAGCGTIGFEIILYWDPTVCGDGNWIVAVYSYGGISVETNDAWIASTIAIMTDNANLLLADAEKNVSQLVILVASSIGSGFSFSISGLAVFGNDSFESPKSYEQSFTSINVGFHKARASFAYSDTGFAVSLGYNCIGGYKLLPSWGVSKSYYKLEQKYVIPALIQ